MDGGICIQCGQWTWQTKDGRSKCYPRCEPKPAPPEVPAQRPHVLPVPLNSPLNRGGGQCSKCKLNLYPAESCPNCMRAEEVPAPDEVFVLVDEDSGKPFDCDDDCVGVRHLMAYTDSKSALTGCSGAPHVVRYVRAREGVQPDILGLLRWKLTQPGLTESQMIAVERAFKALGGER